MAGFDPISMLVIGSIATSAVGAGFNMFSASEAADIRERQIRSQQTALRLQETEADIQNMDNLEHILARQEVMAGVRNIRSDSGSLAALTNDTFTEFDRINDINKLNFTTKKLSLTQASLANSLEKRNGMVKAGLGFAESALTLGTKYKSLLDMQKLASNSKSIAPEGAL
jgi:hypothetical protein